MNQYFLIELKKSGSRGEGKIGTGLILFVHYFPSTMNPYDVDYYIMEKKDIPGAELQPLSDSFYWVFKSGGVKKCLELIKKMGIKEVE